jgi:hypothetical protein
MENSQIARQMCVILDATSTVFDTRADGMTILQAYQVVKTLTNIRRQVLTLEKNLSVTEARL